MCRYAMRSYSCRWACFDCRKAFKAHSANEMPYYEHRDPRPCPECGKPMVDMGQDFKPPRKGNRNQWRKVALMVAQGWTAHDCGCGPAFRRARTSRTLAEAKARARANPDRAFVRANIALDRRG